MDCDECQSRSSGLLDAGQDSRRDPAVEQHLAACPACREFRDTWAVIDVQLTRQAATVLPADFKATLLARLPASRPRLTPAEVAARRAQFEQEHLAALARLHCRHLFLRPGHLLRLFAVAAGFALAGMLLPGVARALVGVVGWAFGGAASGWSLPVLGGATGLIAVLYGLHRAWRQLPAWRFRRWRLAGLPGLG